MFKFCPKCNKSVESFHGRCWQCGAKLLDEKPEKRYWKVSANNRSDHIYIKEKKGNTLRKVAMIINGMVSNKKQSMEDAQLIAKAPQMERLLKKIKNENVSAEIKEEIKDLLGG